MLGELVYLGIQSIKCLHSLPFEKLPAPPPYRATPTIIPGSGIESVWEVQ